MKTKILFFIICLLTPTIILAAQTQVINKEYVKVPEVVQNQTVNMIGTIYKPEGEGPFPLIIATHGGRAKNKLNNINSDYYSSAATALAKKGFTVLVLLRRGYGKSEGKCNEFTRDCFHAAQEGAKDIKAAIEFMNTKSFVDGSKIVLLGKTLGGTVVMAASTMSIPGVIGVISFGGGGVRDGDYTLIDAYSKYGKENKIPALWIYTTNDHSLNYSISLPNKMYDVYTKNGGTVNYIIYGKWGSVDGHDFFDQGVNFWMPYVDEYFQSIGLGDYVTPKKTIENPE